MSIRDRRIRNEWDLLAQLAAINPGVLNVYGGNDGPEGASFHIRLERTRGLVNTGGSLTERDSHAATLILPRFYPSVPIEAVLAVPVFHPNVEPDSGFVCLWERFSPGDAAIDAVRRLQRIIAWDMVNVESHHIMQPEAVVWHHSQEDRARLPLQFVAIAGGEELSAAWKQNINPRFFIRRRLSEIQDS